MLRIDWGKEEQPSRLPNFESLARRYRFRALGKACKEADIDSLFLAHHNDDQAETVMMRLIRGHGTLGLTGMKRESEIPECRGLHGVCESGGLEELPIDSSYHARIVRPSVMTSIKNCYEVPMAVETGGIRIYRPLLSFSKARLIATCQAEHMSWFEDHTNQNPTVTTRNAIRSIFRSHKLPAVLSPPSLSSLIERSQNKMEKLERIVDELFMPKISSFEPRVGTMHVHLPNLFKGAIPGELRKDRGLIAALILRRIFMLVTPDEHIQLSSLHSTVQRLFPEVEGSTVPTEIFTVSGLQIIPNKGSGHTRHECHISRQRPSSTLSRNLCLSFPPVPPRTDAIWSDWELYDGRYWMRICNNSTVPVLVRPFQEQDLVKIKERIEHKPGKELGAVLKKRAPGNVRWTLPVVITEDTPGEERVLGLPTLNFKVSHHEMPVLWEVRYKKVLLGRYGIGSLAQP